MKLEKKAEEAVVRLLIHVDQGWLFEFVRDLHRAYSDEYRGRKVDPNFGEQDAVEWTAYRVLLQLAIVEETRALYDLMKEVSEIKPQPK